LALLVAGGGFGAVRRPGAETAQLLGPSTISTRCNVRSPERLVFPARRVVRCAIKMPPASHISIKSRTGAAQRAGRYGSFSFSGTGKKEKRAPNDNTIATTCRKRPDLCSVLLDYARRRRAARTLIVGRRDLVPGGGGGGGGGAQTSRPGAAAGRRVSDRCYSCPFVLLFGQCIPPLALLA